MTSLVIHAEVTCHLLHELVYLLIGPHKREDQKLIYISRVSLDTFPKSALPQLMERASPERRDRARRYVRIDDCLRCLIADELRAYSLKLDYKVPVQSEVSKNAFGKPLLANRDGPKFNLSHDGKWIVCATRPHPVGVDVEAVAEPGLAVVSNDFSVEEVEALRTTATAPLSIARAMIWTRKEAYLKYLGLGLTVQLDSFSVIDQTLLSPAEGMTDGIQFYSWCDADNSHVISVCGHGEEVVISCVSGQELLDGLPPSHCSEEPQEQLRWLPNLS